MANVICHLCLRTDITAIKIATKLTDFIDELCDYNIIDNPRYQCCTICAHLLKKFYNFKQRCLKACKILKSVKGRPKFLPTDLHEQIPSSLGLCSSLAPYKLLEHQHHTDTDILETKTGLNSEPNITSNNAEEHSKQNLEKLNADPMLPDHIEVKDEPMQEVLDYDVETTQVVNAKNMYVITTSDGYLTINSKFENENKSIKLDADSEEQNTDTNNKGSKRPTKQSKINDYLKSFEEEIKEFDHNSVDEDDMDVKDTTYMLYNDPLRDDESLNSMDDIESDINDCDVESLPMDEQNSESDSDLDSLYEIVEKAKDKKIQINEIYDLELAEILLKVDKKNKVLKRRVQYLKDKGKIKDGILKLFENDEYDLSDGLKVSKEVFLKMYERFEKSCYNIKGCPNRLNTYNFKDTSDKNKTDEFLRNLYKIYNPEYETVFDIEYLDTEEKKLQEFNRRKDRAEYQNAPYQCARCYKGFYIERMRAYHMTKHDESSGPHECHICFVRFPKASHQRKHVADCHSAVYVCRLCHVTFYYFNSMLNHFNLHKGKEFPCPICNGIYRTATGLANHKRTHVTSHICTTCARSFVSAKGLFFHRKKKHKGAPEAGPDAVQCGECPLTLDSQIAYKRHMRISHREHNYVCHCFQSFLSIAELKQHKVDAGHLHNTTSRGNKIGSIVKRKISCRDSRRAQREKTEMKTCPICKEDVPNECRTALYNHHERYHPGVPYQVQDTRVKNYMCEECGKQFLARPSFLDHKNIHTGDRPYKCQECPRAFATAVRLWHHSAGHRPPSHKCKFCGKLFKKSSGLACHMRIHINDRRYICDICSASFIHASSLTEHIKGVHLHQRRVKKRKLEVK